VTEKGNKYIQEQPPSVIPEIFYRESMFLLFILSFCIFVFSGGALIGGGALL
jgi:hypothetical protein